MIIDNKIMIPILIELTGQKDFRKGYASACMHHI